MYSLLGYEPLSTKCWASCLGDVLIVFLLVLLQAFGWGALLGSLFGAKDKAGT